MKSDKAEQERLAQRNYYDALDGSQSISMMMCEKVVLGYSALHHLLLYLQSKNKELITSFADRWVGLFVDKISYSGKWCCKDLGKLLIYTMISSKYKWSDIARHFVYESLTRNVKWMVAQEQYRKYNSTEYLSSRRKDAFRATTTSRRLIMFQVWFSRSNSVETLHSYNQRLGRPRTTVRQGVVPKTKAIMNCKSWNDYFHHLRVDVAGGGQMEIDQLLRFAVWNSSKKRYHIGSAARIQKVDQPNIEAIVESSSGTFVSTNALVIKRFRGGNAWNSSDGHSAVTVLFGRSSDRRKVPRSTASKPQRTAKSVKSTLKSTEQRPQSKEVAAKKMTEPLIKQRATKSAKSTEQRPQSKVAAKKMTEPLSKQSTSTQQPPQSKTQCDSKQSTSTQQPPQSK